MPDAIVITGIGLVTPLGDSIECVLDRLESGKSAATTVTDFAPEIFGCRVWARLPGLSPEPHVTEKKLLRLMNQEAQMAVVAAAKALEDAGIKPGKDYAPEDIGLFGATGTAGLPISEFAPLLNASSNVKGDFDLNLFGNEGLRAVSPILSFKILGNMPTCFVSMCLNLQGVNAVYTPWEGNGAQAIAAAKRALNDGDARCVLAGGADVKTHELAFATLSQLGLFDSWKTSATGIIPGQGAVFLVMEKEPDARARNARIYARLDRIAQKSACSDLELPHLQRDILAELGIGQHHVPLLVGAANGNPVYSDAEAEALRAVGGGFDKTYCPKNQGGDLFAAAAALQVAVAAACVARYHDNVLANCFGFGSEQAAFLLEMP